MNSVNRLTLEELTALRNAYAAVLRNGARVLSGSQVGDEFSPSTTSCVNLHHAIIQNNPEFDGYAWRLDAAISLLLHWYCVDTETPPYLADTGGTLKRNLYPFGHQKVPVGIWSSGKRMLYLAWAIGKIEQRITELESKDGNNQSN